MISRSFRLAMRPTRLNRRSRGQTLVEFALIFPLFFVLLIGIIEFGFVLNAMLAVNFSTREAALLAAEAGNADGSDCLILQKVEEAIDTPADIRNVSQVLIYRADRLGGKLETNVYVRTGSTTCHFATRADVVVPYTLPAGEKYEDVKRCNILAGCPANAPLPARTAVDQIGVEVTYQYSWHTPLSGLLNFTGNGYSIVKSNVMRMEPIL
jgi:hypothetical protein